MTQTEARPYMSVSVQIDTPDAPPLDGRPVHLVSWIASRFSHSTEYAQYTIFAHHRDGGDLTTILDAKSIDPDMVPDWVPWPPANWLASLELGKPDLIGQASVALDAATIARVNGGRRQF